MAFGSRPEGRRSQELSGRYEKETVPPGDAALRSTTVVTRAAPSGPGDAGGRAAEGDLRGRRVGRGGGGLGELAELIGAPAEQGPALGERAGVFVAGRGLGDGGADALHLHRREELLRRDR